ncbi:lactase/phlorizin hydrolase-like [Lycorma delicatula]|uniref:lactase/phlorizin hydrolase-like n=1 Tax=Lycorma delicatula TaxID=130591 RepID=UPI003F50DD37
MIGNHVSPFYCCISIAVFSGIFAIVIVIGILSEQIHFVSHKSAENLKGLDETMEDSRTFPKEFFIGCASASYQVEGAWNEDGKGENIWDFYTRTQPDLIKDHSNGDIACDSYHKYKEDVKLIKNIGFDVYRFSISWSRVLPTGEDYDVNEAGIQYYRNLIEELLENGIKPLVTLYHWDLPYPLSKLGGWVNPLMADYFEKFARVVFSRLGDKVKLWITINEPLEVVQGYGDKEYPPVLDIHGVGEYLAAHTLLRAHAKAYHVYDKEFRSSQNGKIGITLNSEFAIPKTVSASDREAAEISLQFMLGWFAHPIFSKEGDYPPVMRQKIDENSKAEKRSSSRLPTFTAAEVEELKGSYDFFGLNHYTSRLVTRGTSGKSPSWARDCGVIKTVDPKWPGSASNWLKNVPSGFRGLLNWIKNEYGNPPVIVTENGFSDSGELDDVDRIEYFSGYLKELLSALHDDKCNVIGYLAWSIIDNFEWFKGYTERFGIYHVDFKDKNRTRTEKRSVNFFKKLMIDKVVPDEYSKSNSADKESMSSTNGTTVKKRKCRKQDDGYLEFAFTSTEINGKKRPQREVDSIVLLIMTENHVLPLYCCISIAIFSGIFAIVIGKTVEDSRRFPKGFFIGCVSAAYQVEGAWNEDGKGENIWDFYTHTQPDLIKDHSNGDVACDSYHKYKEDVKLIKNIGFDVYRFSISWSRVLPTGEDYDVNEAGIQYYRNLIEELLKNGIKPMVTLYHWDLPYPLSKLGGWVNPLMADYFEKFARVVFSRLGDKVKLWITINEPFEVVQGYGDKEYAPVLDIHGVGEYLAAHTLLRAHAKAYHVYDKEFRPSQNGKIGITLDTDFAIPKSVSVSDREAAEISLQFMLGWFAHPIFSKEGDYPPVMRQKIDENSKAEKRSSSRLPTFTAAEVEELKGSYDFFGLNHYTSRLVTRGTSGISPSWAHDSGVIRTVDPRWPGSASDWLKSVPSGFRGILNWIKNEYGNPPVIVTENGFSDSGELDDVDRIEYFSGYLKELLKALHDDKCNVVGYLAWSIIDNFEWFGGYTERFGIYHVDFKDKNRTRTEKRSVNFFKKLMIDKVVPDEY